MKKFYFLALIAIVFFAGQTELRGQGFYNYKWYFGTNDRGLVFSKTTAEPSILRPMGQPFGSGSSVVGLEPFSGSTMFYSDGLNVFDGSNLVMPNGNGLTGNSNSRQGLATAPVNGLGGNFFIFYRNGGNILHAVVDMNQAGNSDPLAPPSGDVVIKNEATTITNNAGPIKMISFPAYQSHALIYQRQASLEIALMRVGDLGTPLAEHKTINLSNPFPIGAIAYNEATGKIALIPEGTNFNIQILQYDVASDSLYLLQEVLNSALLQGAMFDAEFSRDGSKLYVSQERPDDVNSIGQVVQYDLDIFNAVPVRINDVSLRRSYGLKLGPNNQVYHLFQENDGGPFRIASFNFPDSAATNISYNDRAFGNQNFNARNFPEFLQKPLEFTVIDFHYQDSCANNSVQFSAQVIPTPSSITWSVPDVGTFQGSAPLITFPNPGSIQVSMTARLGGLDSTITKTINILSNPPQDILEGDTTICPGETLELDAGAQGTYVWSTGETTRTITVNEAGTYWVSITFPGGCTQVGSKRVQVYGELNNTANFWYFGNRAGLDFNVQDDPSIPIPVPLNDGAMNAPEGCATVSDINGDLLFYTDGSTVWNKEHDIMLNGTDIGGDPNSAQSSIIIPVPLENDPTLFYIFTTSAVFGDNSYALSYSLVDLKRDNGNGEVVKKNIVLFTRSTERMTSTAPGPQTILVAHEYGNANFRTYRITDQGISNPLISTVGSVHQFTSESFGQGTMKLSPNGQLLAVALAEGNQNFVEILEFDGATGELSNPIKINLNAPGQVYGIEFSPDNTRLFATTLGSPSRLFEIRLDTLEENFIQQSVNSIHTSNGFQLGSIQIAPNGSVYVAQEGQAFLGLINVATDSLLPSSYTEQGQNLAAGTTSRLGLPNFGQFNADPIGAPGMEVLAACTGQESSFFGFESSDIDEFFWTLGDGTTSTEQNVLHIYQNPGVYEVALNIRNRCGLDTTFTQTIEIFQGEIIPQPVQIVELCGDEVTLRSGLSGAGLVFEWTYLGQVIGNDSIQVATGPGEYRFSVINQGGCVSQGEVLLLDGRPDLDLGPDAFYCQDEEGIVLDSQYPGASLYRWFRNGLLINGANARTLALDTSSPGIFEYIVEVTDGVTGCVGLDTVNITINERPLVDFTVIDSSCGNDTGEISFTINSNGTFNTTIVSGGNSFYSNTSLSNGVNETVSNLPSGIFTLRAVNTVTGCEFLEVITINDSDPNFDITLTPNIDCNINSVSLSVLINQIVGERPIAFDYIYELVDNSNGLVVNQSSADNPSFVIPNLQEGSYTITVIDDSGNGCTSSASIDIVFNLPEFEVLGIDACADENGNQNLSVNITNTIPNPVVEWFLSPNMNTHEATGQNVSLSQSGNYTVRVSSPDPSVCIAEQNFDLIINTTPTVSIELVGDACDVTRTLRVVASPGNINWIYRWSTLEQSQEITVDRSGTYEVLVRNPNNPSCVTTASIQVTIEEPLQVEIENYLACDDGTEVEIRSQVNRSSGVSYQWFRNGNPIANSNNPFIIVADNVQATYEVRVTVGSCTESASTLFRRAPTPVVELPASLLICPQDEDPAVSTARLDAGPGGTVYEWYNLDNPSFSFFGRVLVTQQPGRYVVEVSNPFGCIGSDTTAVTVDCEPRIFAPNAFSPDGNGINDEWFIFTNPYIDDFEVWVYNRWGEQVFYADNKDFRWDGLYRGNTVPTGTYAVVFRYTSIYDPGVKITQRSGLTVLK